MFEKVKIKKRKPRTIAYIRHKGDHSKIPYKEYIDRLYEWSKRKRARPGMRPMSIYIDNPKKKPKNKLRTDIAVPIKKGIKGEGKIKIKDLPKSKFASMKFKGSPDEYDKAYSELEDWIKENGYKISGKPVEIFTGTPKEEKGKTVIRSRIEIPIK